MVVLEFFSLLSKDLSFETPPARVAEWQTR
jgi:hypothetical protein